MNDLKVFSYESAEIRTAIIDGAPWWVLKDVCDVLDLSNPTVAGSRLEENERAKLNLGRQGETTIVNESGLYSLILSSRKPEARAFQKWITSEVLPSIRKTGKYSIVKDMTGGFSLPKTFSEALRLAADQAEQIEKMLPKANVYDRIADSAGLKTVQEVAAILGYGSTTFFSILRDKGIFYKTNGTNLPKREHIEAGRFVVKEELFTRNGEEHTYSRIFVTPKGELWLSEILEVSPQSLRRSQARESLMLEHGE